MASATSSQAALERTFRLMDVADEIRRRHQRVQEHLETSDREKIKEHLLERYRAMGHEADPELIEEAIETVLRQQNRFRPAGMGISRLLARIYVRRAWIGKVVVAPIVILAALTGLGVTGVEALRDRRAAGAERQVEERATALFADADQLQDRIQRVSAGADDLKASAQHEVQRLADQAQSHLDDASRLLDQMAPGGNVPAAVTGENYKQFAEKLPAITASLDAGRGLAREAEAKARAVGESGSLLKRAQELHGSIAKLAREQGVTAQADGLLGDARTAAAAAETDRLKRSVDDLVELERALDQEYDVVVLRGRERDNTRHYLIVQAVDRSGRPVTVRVRNEETGKFESVREWGERVPKRIYDQVAADYRQDNVIDDNRFGHKKRGYLQMERRYEDLGQITRY